MPFSFSSLRAPRPYAHSIYFLYNPDLRYLELGKVSALVEAYLTRALFIFTTRYSNLVLALPPATVETRLETAAAERGADGDDSGMCRAAVAALHGGPPCTPAAPLAAAPGLLRYLDLNFYVHGVTTMNYKRNFQPSDLLCPLMGRHHWRAITPKVLQRMDADSAAPLALVPSSSATSPGSALIDDPDAVRAAAAAAASQEAATATESVPEIMLTISGGTLAPVAALTQPGQALLRKGMIKFACCVGPDLAQRSVVCPDWVAEVSMQEKAEADSKAAKKAARAARRQAAEAALLEAALEETLGGTGSASSTATGGGGAL